MDKMEAGRVKFESELSTIDLSARSSAQLGVKMNKIRLTVQLIYTILTNGYVFGYLNGKIYQIGRAHV